MPTIPQGDANKSISNPGQIIHVVTFIAKL